jgi:hypothetical protein
MEYADRRVQVSREYVMWSELFDCYRRASRVFFLLAPELRRQ